MRAVMDRLVAILVLTVTALVPMSLVIAIGWVLTKLFPPLSLFQGSVIVTGVSGVLVIAMLGTATTTQLTRLTVALREITKREDEELDEYEDEDQEIQAEFGRPGPVLAVPKPPAMANAPAAVAASTRTAVGKTATRTCWC